MAADLLKPVFPDVKRSYHQSRGGHEAADLENCDPFWVEVRVGKAPSPWKAWKDAAENASKQHIPLAIVHRDNGPWLAMISVDDLVNLLKEQKEKELNVAIQTATEVSAEFSKFVYRWVQEKADEQQK